MIRRRRALETIAPRTMQAQHAEPDVTPSWSPLRTEALARVSAHLIDDPETFWRHVTLWQCPTT